MKWNLDKNPDKDKMDWISFLINHGASLRMIFIGDPATGKTQIKKELND